MSFNVAYPMDTETEAGGWRDDDRPGHNGEHFGATTRDFYCSSVNPVRYIGIFVARVPIFVFGLTPFAQVNEMRWKNSRAICGQSE